MIIADTSGLLALFSRREPAHAAVARAVDQSRDVLVVSPFVIAELDCLLATQVHVDSELAVLRELAGGAYQQASIGPSASF